MEACLTFFLLLETFSFINFMVRIKWHPMKQFSVKTQSRTEFINLDRHVEEVLRDTHLTEGVLTIFIPHTTAGVTINENADPDVTADMEVVLDRMVPWNGGYKHSEGNTAAHVKASMMGSSVHVIVSGGILQLGTWQSLYFCEFDGPRTRTVWVKGISGT
jgi:secondary thiamine-phosphate synthase enzyme